jgi:hypothetical protein
LTIAAQKYARFMAQHHNNLVNACHTSARTAIPPICSGCNEPGRFRKGHLDKGTQGSLLMAFPARE